MYGHCFAQESESVRSMDASATFEDSYRCLDSYGSYGCAIFSSREFFIYFFYKKEEKGILSSDG